MRKHGERIKAHRGCFVDIKTLAAAITSESFSLARLAKFLNTPTQKHETDEHGGPITEAYLDYARADVQATWECYEALILRFAEHGLDTSVHRILSEASIGKGYLKQMGIKPLLGYQPDIPRSIFGKIMGSYYGGRAEVRIRRVVTRVLYCDFKSMYPTVNALMGLWRFVIGGKLTRRDTTAETQAFLDHATLEDLQSRETWRALTTLVRIRPDQDILPVRARYDGKINTIGLNFLKSDQPLWYTLADCLASKLLTGKTPIIVEAQSFDPGPIQDGLTSFELFGNPEFRVDPNTDDLFARLIDLRDEAKANGDPAEKALKIVANSTVYGIFIEVNRDNAPKPEPLDVYGPDDRDATDFREWSESYKAREPGCIFCVVPQSRIIAENELAFAIRDGFPVTELHTLIIPRRHCAGYFDLYQPELNAMNQLIQLIRESVMKEDSTVSGFNLGANAGTDAGQTIMHCHMHLIPRRNGDVKSPRGGVRGVIPGRQSY